MEIAWRMNNGLFDEDCLLFCRKKGVLADALGPFLLELILVQAAMWTQPVQGHLSGKRRRRPKPTWLYKSL